MATVKAFIRVSTKKSDNVNVRFRLSDGRDIQLFHKSEITVNPDFWESEKQIIKPRVIYKADDRLTFDTAIVERKQLILSVYNAASNKDNLTSDWLENELDKKLHPENYKPTEDIKLNFFEIFTEFLDKHKLSKVRKNNYRVVLRALQRYELYTATKMQKPFKLHLDTITANTLHDAADFFSKEYEICTKMPEIYAAIPESRIPQKRGQNTINDIFTKIRTFYLWAINSGRTQNNPFKSFKVEECVYGTPYYISIDERNKLYKKDLSHRPHLAVQRDIFVFQCLIGCRVGDLYKMTKSNVINGAIEYIPRKTKDGRPLTVRVPLNATAKEILSTYADTETDSLFPFISEQKYNLAIKEAFLEAELTRMVTVINPTTRLEEKVALNKLASSHLARRCFIGNLFKQVKDPNLVGALSGHKEGSRAFARYREIDEEMKTDLVNLLV